MRTSPEINEIAKAMAEAQGAIKNPAKDKANSHFKTTYADIASGLDVIRPALSKAGVAFFQATEVVDDGVILVTRLVHAGSGQWVEGSYPVCKSAPHQQMGAALTYARRQALFALVGVHGEDEDDDGEAAGNADTTTRRAPQRQIARPAAGPDESQRACKTAIVSKFTAAPTSQALDSEWKPAVVQMEAVGIDKNHEFYAAIVQSFKDCKISLQEREARQHKEAV